MKKLIAMAAVAMILMMASCSGDDSESTNNPGGDGPLLTKMIETYDGETYTTNFHYDGNRITHITSDGGDTELTYSGDKLTKLESFSEDGELISKQTFQYHPDGKLAVEISAYYYDFIEDVVKTVFTHNSNGTISFERYLGDETSQTELSSTGTIVMQGGNIVSINTDSDGEESTRTFTFDDKNSPFKNMHAYEVIILSDFEGGVNNILSEIDTEDGDTYTSTYTYNSEGYPVTSSDTWDGDPDGDYQYFYN